MVLSALGIYNYKVIFYIYLAAVCSPKRRFKKGREIVKRLSYPRLVSCSRLIMQKLIKEDWKKKGEMSGSREAILIPPFAKFSKFPVADKVRSSPL